MSNNGQSDGRTRSRCSDKRPVGPEPCTRLHLRRKARMASHPCCRSTGWVLSAKPKKPTASAFLRSSAAVDGRDIGDAPSACQSRSTLFRAGTHPRGLRLFQRPWREDQGVELALLRTRPADRPLRLTNGRVPVVAIRHLLRPRSSSPSCGWRRIELG